MSKADHQEASITNLSERSFLACHRCRDRKIKCDRTRPTCRMCARSTTLTCSYPTTSQKPGPKPGVPQRRRSKQVRDSSLYHPADARLPASSVVEHTVGWSTVSQGLSDERGSKSVHGDQESNHFMDLTNESRRMNNLAESSTARVLTVSHLLHPTHEPTQQPTSEKEPEASIWDGYEGLSQKISSSCMEFGITEPIYRSLFDAYFDNITFVSLFHRPTFESKLADIQSLLQFQALIASMFAISARFISSPDPRTGTPLPEHFHALGSHLLEGALRDCGDYPPPLCLLQALILLTFVQLADGVRGRAWRRVGACVSIAYELQLHLLDKDEVHHNRSTPAILEEEKRRAWWAIWECDVFASTIRRLPTTIDWQNNLTWLPVTDEQWFTDAVPASSVLHPDPAKAWKVLEESGNKSPKAWFVVINALMRSAHLLSSPQFYPTHHRSQQVGEASQRLNNNLEILANSLYCLLSAMPREFRYSGEYLYFAAFGAKSRSTQHDEAKYSIHIMVQLSQFMLHHQAAFFSATRLSEVAETHGSLRADRISVPERSSWSHYIAAATEIVAIVRNSSQQHFRYTNPFLANTIWLAAAAQIVAKTFDPPLMDTRLADSNLELLRINLKGYAEFWGMSTVLQQKLGMLGQGLEDTNTTRQQHYSGSSRTKNGMPGSLDNIGATRRRKPWPLSQRPIEHYLPWSDGEDPSSLTEDDFVRGSGMAVREVNLAPAMDETIPPESWGWGLDELLTYGGVEYL